jgi:hypothetical protein
MKCCGSTKTAALEIDHLMLQSPVHGENDDDNIFVGATREDEEGETRPDGFLTDLTDEEEDENDDSDNDDDDYHDNSKSLRCSSLGCALAALAFLLSALSLGVSVATFLRPPTQQATSLSPPRPGTSCASGEALLALTRTEPAQLDRVQVCISEPVRWEAMPKGVVCKHGGIRVALEEGGAAELCGMDNMSSAHLSGRMDAAKEAAGESESAALITSFIADEAVRIGQVVSLSEKGGVVPYRLFRNMVWKQECKSVAAVSVGFGMIAFLCTPPPSQHTHAAFMKLCKAQHQGALVCSGILSAVAPMNLKNSADHSATHSDTLHSEPQVTDYLKASYTSSLRPHTLVD